MTGASAKGRGALEVIVFEESRFRGSLMFTSAEVTVGSDAGVMVRLNDADIAPCHAVLFFDGENCTIENYDENTGTQLNGVSIARQELSATDELQIGRFRLRITVHRADATPAPVSVRAPARPAVAKAAPSPAARPAPTVRQPSPVPATSPASRPAPPSPAARVPSPVPGAPSPIRGVFPPPPPSRAVSPVPATASSARGTPSPPSTSRPAPGLPSPGGALSKTVPVGGSTPQLPPARSAPLPAPPVAPKGAAAAKPPKGIDVVPDWDNVPTVPTRPEPPTPLAKTAVLPASAPPAPTALAIAPDWDDVPTVSSQSELDVRPPPAPSKPALAALPGMAAPAQKRTATQVLVSRSSPAAAGPPQRKVVEVGNAPRAVLALPSAAVSDDDDEDDEHFQPAFSLLEQLRGTGVVDTQHRAVEIVRFRHGCVLKLQHLRRGEKLRLHGMRKAVGRCAGAGEFVFQREAVPESAAVSINGRTVADSAWRAKADKRGRIVLEPATQVIFPLPSGEGVLIHLVPAAAPLPASTWRPRLTRLMATLAGVSVLVHIIVFAILGLASLVRRDYIADNKEGRFARIALKEVELEPPVTPPKQEEKKKKKPKPEPSQASSEAPPPKLASLHLPRTRSPSKATETASTATTQKLLSALGSMSAGPKPMSATAMSNLDAVGPVKGGGFKVSGAIGKLPGDSLRLAAAGSGMGRLDTKSTSDVGKDLGRVLGRGPTGQVRAQVTARPNTMKVEGHLDRGEIQKVINAHIHELQGCYERQLIASPNLSGKVTFEWVIGTSGAVTVVKIKSSSLSSNDATSCMQAAIRRWMFPAPSGGQVTVVYPIALANSGT